MTTVNNRYSTAAELYQAARETCQRLYVANGGNPDDIWTVQPFPGTAAISRELLREFRRGKHKTTFRWKLCMPAYPVGARLPRWHCDLIGAYTVHELLHALWTDWAVVRESILRNVANLTNALEDVRIEKRAQRHLDKVGEAKRLLEMLTAHIVDKSVSRG